MTDDPQRTKTTRQKVVQKGFVPGPGVGRPIQERLSSAVPACAAPGCTNPGGAFISERDGRIHKFCAEGCRTKFER
jgi:hypothetical protein